MKKILLLSALLIVVAICPAFCQVITPASNVIYVKNDAAGDGSGSSWANAVPELADALKWARDNQSAGLWTTANPLQIWVAKGTYKPRYQHNDGGGSSRPVLNSFVMVRDVAIYGGFSGTENSLANRINWKSNQTILSGELDVPHTEGGNSYTSVCHVVVAAGSIGNAVLDGFTVSGGKAELFDYIDVNTNLTDASRGGGIYLTSSYPTLRNLIVNGNTSADNGAGIYMQSISSNTTVLSLSGVSLTENFSDNNGGGIYQDRIRLATHNCSFTGNIALRGAAIFSDFSYLTFVNTLVAGNHANESVVSGSTTVYQYGALYPRSSNVEIINSTISSNMGGPAYTLDGGNVTSVKNSIINNHNYSISGLTESRVTNSIIQYITSNNGSNLAGSTNPRFVNGRSYTNAPFTDGDYRLQLNSPVLDKGLDASYPGSLASDTDLAGRRRLAGASIDMGAYEGGYDPLPVTMISFRAEKEQSRVHLKWVTTLETNASHFELQKSADGNNFHPIGTVPATGESNKPVHYQFSDEHSGIEKITYYRIRTVDQDESDELSQIVSVKWYKINGSLAKLYPNPTQGNKVVLDLKASGRHTEITVFDISGRQMPVVMREIVEGAYELAVDKLSAGLYLVKANVDGQSVVNSRLIVK